MKLCLAAALFLQATPREESVAIPDSKVSFTLVPVPGGTVARGEVGDSSAPAYPIRPFLIGKHEVTWTEFDVYDAAAGSRSDWEGKLFLSQVGCPAEWFEPQFPAFALRWHSVLAYCDWLSEKTGRRFRVPTEAEWEHAGRAGRPRAALDEGWHSGNGRRLQPAGRRTANPWGLHDMIGNVWEYCLDSDRPGEYSPVFRGGGWDRPVAEVNAAARRTVDPEWYAADPTIPRSTWWFLGGFNQGFRVACIDAADQKTLEGYVPRIAVRVLGMKPFTAKERPALGSFGVQVRGELENRGDRTIEELDLTVYYLDPKGRPHLRDVVGSDRPGRATFGRCYPVMTPLCGKGEESRPLRPGEARAWAVEIPGTTDDEDEVDAEKFGARVTALRFSEKP